MQGFFGAFSKHWGMQVNAISVPAIQTLGNTAPQRRWRAVQSRERQRVDRLQALQVRSLVVAALDAIARAMAAIAKLPLSESQLQDFEAWSLRGYCCILIFRI